MEISDVLGKFSSRLNEPAAPVPVLSAGSSRAMCRQVPGKNVHVMEAEVPRLVKRTDLPPPSPKGKQIALVRTASGGWRGRRSMASHLNLGSRHTAILPAHAVQRKSAKAEK